MVIKVMGKRQLCVVAFQRVALWFEPRKVLRPVAEELESFTSQSH
jgi:hypothetical protein